MGAHPRDGQNDDTIMPGAGRRRLLAAFRLAPSSLEGCYFEGDGGGGGGGGGGDLGCSV